MTQAEVFEYRHGGTLLEGYAAYPVGSGGRHPGVMVVHEWFGVNAYVRKRAEMIAELGYTGLAVDMFGQGVHVRSVEEAGEWYGKVMTDRSFTRARIAAALRAVREDRHVDPTKVACIGYCMGGTVALELARAGADVRGVASFHGALTTTMPAKKGDIKCPIQVHHGADDPLVPQEQVEAFHQEMEEVGADWQFYEYPGAVHSFTNSDANRPADGVKYDADADRKSWETLKSFLARVLA